jgi:hypothetical protein
MSMMNTPGQMASGSASMMDRIMGVITLKAPIYRQIADDQTATGQAAIIVVIATLVAGFFRGLVRTEGGVTALSFGAAIIGAIVLVVIGLIGWGVGAWVLAFVAKWFGGKTNTMEMLRVTGYVHVFDFVSVVVVLALASSLFLCLVGLIAFIAAILRLIGYVIGVREAAEFSTGNAIITAIVAWVVEFIIAGVIGGTILLALLVAFGLARSVAG